MPPPSGEGRVTDLKALIEKHGLGPVLMAGIALYALLARPERGPCRRCRGAPCLCPPVCYRTAGAWRGRGSFGKAPFGPQGRRR